MLPTSETNHKQREKSPISHVWLLCEYSQSRCNTYNKSLKPNSREKRAPLSPTCEFLNNTVSTNQNILKLNGLEILLQASPTCGFFMRAVQLKSTANQKTVKLNGGRNDYRHPLHLDFLAIQSTPGAVNKYNKIRRC